MCFVCLLTLLSANGKPQASTQSAQCVGEQASTSRSCRSCPQCQAHTHSHTLSVSVHILRQNGRDGCSLQRSVADRKQKLFLRLRRTVKALTRRGLGAALRSGPCRFNRWSPLTNMITALPVHLVTARRCRHAVVDVQLYLNAGVSCPLLCPQRPRLPAFSGRCWGLDTV